MVFFFTRYLPNYPLFENISTIGFFNLLRKLYAVCFHSSIVLYILISFSPACNFSYPALIHPILMFHSLTATLSSL